ncbi:MAG: hypothetical protein CMK74_00745 [Pseudomonadales bacterium]|nr:hypothetical protein [Pseudomonadales bacterium]
MSKAKVNGDLSGDTFFSKLGVPLTSLEGAKHAISAARYTPYVVPCLVGDAGIGKTHLVRQIAQGRKPTTPFEWHGKTWKDSVPMVALYLAHMQAEDIGVPYPSRARKNEQLKECELYLRIAAESENGFGEKAKTHAFAIAEKALENGTDLDDGTFEFLVERTLADLPPEGILFLDEWNRAEKQVIKAFFTILEDRRVHGTDLVPQGIQIVAAMNPSDSAYAVNEAEKDYAFRRRLSFVAVAANEASWIRYADGAGDFHPHVVEFIKAHPAHLYDRKLRDSGKAFPCPATWEKVSDLLKAADARKQSLTSDGIHYAISGCIGQDPANTLRAYVQDNEVVIAPDDVIKHYTEKSKVRSRVRKLIKQNRNDALSELCAGVALTLFTGKPDPEKISASVVLFLSDLKPEMAMSMIEHHFGNQADNVENGGEYLGQLSIAMHTYPAYGALFDNIGSAMQAVREELDEDAKDPLV